ncbi:urease accessory protein [Paenibacillus cellulosilyticus]|uniref:Urease accessory protein UreD n=2 Tax=Paenibacillus cellulosilyticus TaxID=375489 RepID=A0A2V2YQC5_9BACL|nr:urease accessory protein [Paenibacillus cellulosilyticus]QKS43377.1 urease accessory protein UreD [Paenibacillus cellulosilyticus]
MDIHTDIRTTTTIVITRTKAREDAALGLTRLQASFEQHGERTVMTRKYHTAPLKIAKAFPQGAGLGVIVMDVSPGLLDGDQYELEWHCGRGSRLYVTNQSYTKVHPAGGKGGASLRQSFVLEEDAIVEHMPEPVMLYRQAALRSETEVRLAPGSLWIQGDVWCPGRTLRGETFMYDRFDSRLTVRYGDELIASQRQLIEPAIQRLQVQGSWGNATHIGTLFAFGDRIKAQHVEAIREALDSLPDRSEYKLVVGASLTHRCGLAVMAAGTAAWPLQEALRGAWSALRSSLLGEPPHALVQV